MKIESELLYQHLLLFSYGVDGSVTNFDDISCSTSGLSVLQQCVFSTVISTLCTDNDDISVNCCEFYEL